MHDLLSENEKFIGGVKKAFGILWVSHQKAISRIVVEEKNLTQGLKTCRSTLFA